MMNKQASLHGAVYQYCESLTNPISGDSTVICQDSDGDRYACSMSEWIANAISIPAVGQAKVNTHSSKREKINLYLSLFRGRKDVYAKRYYNFKTQKSGYVPACRNEWEAGICDKRAYSCSDCPNRNFVPFTEDVITRHLRGDDKYFRDVVGMYPLLEDETTYILAIDFDKEGWKDDISAFRNACKELKVPVHIERSRSGNGAHAWSFFDVPVPAVDARKFGSGLLTFAMSRRHEIKFASYDRLFPNQDTMPKGGFGNLIALPLQGRSVLDKGMSYTRFAGESGVV